MAGRSVCCRGSGGNIRSRAALLQLRDLLKCFADIAEALFIRFLRRLVGFQLRLHNVLTFQKKVNHLAAQLHFAAARFIQQVLQNVRGLLQHIKTKGPCPALQRVGHAEDAVQLFDIRINGIQLQQLLLHLGEQLLRFGEEHLRKFIHVHDYHPALRSRLCPAAAWRPAAAGRYSLAAPGALSACSGPEC